MESNERYKGKHILSKRNDSTLKVLPLGRLRPQDLEKGNSVRYKVKEASVLFIFRSLFSSIYKRRIYCFCQEYI